MVKFFLLIPVLLDTTNVLYEYKREKIESAPVGCHLLSILFCLRDTRTRTFGNRGRDSICVRSEILFRQVNPFIVTSDKGQLLLMTHLQR